MNLHIVPDNVFINKFYENLREAGVADNNKIVVRTNRTELQYLKHPFPSARLYTPGFDSLTGDTSHYQKVFIHQFTPLLYRWVAQRNFVELNWMIWGSDLYNLPAVDAALYEDLTLRKFIRGTFAFDNILYRAKVFFLHNAYRRSAYGKVSNVLTWMTSEFDFAKKHIPTLKAGHQFFFYENETPYHTLDEILVKKPVPPGKRPVYVLGNSATPELNHLDAVASLAAQHLDADLIVPISYGNKKYGRFLKKSLSFYSGGEVRFLEDYMSFKEYLGVLHGADGLIMNNIRPQGYGNILMMMYMNRKVFLNEKNLSVPELDKAGLSWQPVSQIKSQHIDW